MNTAKAALATLLLIWASAGFAQSTILEQKDNRQYVRMGLYPPDILMRHQQRLGISKEQRTRIAALVRKFQDEVTELQWSMPAEQQVLREMLRQPEIDSEAALAQIRTVMDMESQFKLDHFKLLVAIKQELTTEQIETIERAIRRRGLQTD